MNTENASEGRVPHCKDSDSRGEVVAECVEYFRDIPAFSRILLELRKKYQRYGKAAGTILLPDASVEECQALGGLLGESLTSPLKCRVDRVESAIQETRFKGVTLRELLEAYFGQAMETRKQIQKAWDEEYLQMLAETKPESRVSRQWILELGRDRKNQTLFRAMKQDRVSAGLALSQACQAMDWLEQHRGLPVRLAVLSAHATGSPHTLDRGTLCGNLFLHLLRFKNGHTSQPNSESGSTEQSDALYYECGILRDSISSCVSQTGLILNENGTEHPAFSAFRRRHEICTLSLANLSKLDSAASPSGRAYVVENEMVFSQLCDCADRFHSPVICTSGQLSTAALRLLDLLSVSNTAFFYAGDFDGNGLSIASRLYRRYTGNLHLWHMEEADYWKCRTNTLLTKESAALLNRCEGLEQIAKTVKTDGHAGYQEYLIRCLLKDLTG